MTFEQLCGQMGDEAMIDIPYFLGELNAGQDSEVNHLTRSGRLQVIRKAVSPYL